MSKTKGRYKSLVVNYLLLDFIKYYKGSSLYIDILALNMLGEKTKYFIKEKIK